MASFKQYRIITLMIAICFAVSVSMAQSRYEGDAFITYLGRDSGSQELSNFKKSYSFEMANENHYLSKEGIELILKDGTLVEINLYSHSSVYGSFKGRLPKGLSFGMSSGEVKRILGKPSTAYNSGYCEFDLRDCGISCWFEGDHLSQVTLNVKGG